jgi:predicted nucleic acid-binding protein
MTGFLLDTNIVSELSKAKHRRDPRVVAWLAEHHGSCWLSVITILEICKGICSLRARQAERAARLDAWFARIRHTQAERIIAVDEAIARLAGELIAAHKIAVEDALIAATADRRHLVCLTKNMRHFLPTGVKLLHPTDFGGAS